MPINSDLNKVISVISLQDKSKDAIAQSLPIYEDLEDLFADMADNKAKVEPTFQVIVDTNIVSDIDIRRVLILLSGCWPTLLIQALHGPTSLAWCMSLTSDCELSTNPPRQPRLHQTLQPHPSAARSINASTNVLTVDAK
jgi:hypothetical protein